MAKIIPKWLDRRYLLIAKQFGEKSFDFDAVSTFLKRNFNDEEPTVSLVLSELKRAGWLNVDIDKKDSRKRVYSLVMMYKEEALSQLVAEIKEDKNGRV